MATPNNYSRKFYGYKHPHFHRAPLSLQREMAGREARQKIVVAIDGDSTGDIAGLSFVLFDCYLFLHAFFAALACIFTALAFILLATHA